MIKQTMWLAVARKQTTSKEILLWMTPSEAPKALQTSECSELLDPMPPLCLSLPCFFAWIYVFFVVCWFSAWIYGVLWCLMFMCVFTVFSDDEFCMCFYVVFWWFVFCVFLRCFLIFRFFMWGIVFFDVCFVCVFTCFVVFVDFVCVFTLFSDVVFCTCFCVVFWCVVLYVFLRSFLMCWFYVCFTLFYSVCWFSACFCMFFVDAYKVLEGLCKM